MRGGPGATFIKDFRRVGPFKHELTVYERLTERGLLKLRGFHIPQLADFDEAILVLIIGCIQPPYIINFGAAAVDRRPADF